MRVCRSTTLLLLALGSLGAAESAPEPVPRAADAGIGPAIIVTGSKVDAEIGQVPASVAVASGQEIEDRGDRTLDDLVGRMSNIHAINLGMHTSYPVIRGISGLSDECPATILVDGTAPRGMALDTLLDVEQVEVLRGPQGTLYGRSSIPGVVVVTTREPGRSWSGSAGLDAGSYRTYGAHAAAGGPLIATDGGGVGIRLAVAGETSDGWRTNVIDDDDEAAERTDVQAQGKLAWDIGSGWKVTLSGRGERFLTTGDQFAPLRLARRHETQNSNAGEFTNRLAAGGATIEQRSGDRVFSAITGASAGTDVFDIDIDFSPLPGNTLHKATDNRQLSQELRYGGGQGLRSWLVGIYAARDVQDVAYGQTITPLLNPALPFTYESDDRGIQTTQDLAVFGQIGLPIGPGWTINLGLRAERSATDVDFTGRDNLSPGFDYTDDRSDVELLPKAVLSYAWDDDTLTWLSASRGFKGGGYNLAPASLAEIEGGYDPETAWSYELGQRVATPDRDLRLSFAGFYTDYRDKQVTILEPPQTYLVRNAARATIIGVESDAALRIAPGVDLLAGAGALRATFKEYQADPSSDLSGNHLPMAPSYDAYIGTQWRGESGLFARIDLNAVGSYYADDRNEVDQDAYGLLGARIGYEAEHWAVYLWARNLLDAEYITRASVSPTAGAVAVSGEPQVFGVSASGRF